MITRQTSSAVLLSLTLLMTGCVTSRATGGAREVRVFGEIHGTEEIPRFFLNTVKLELKHSGMASVGLEITADDLRTACDASTISAPARPANRWLGDRHDGRLSGSMADITCKLTRMRGVKLIPLISDDDSPLRDKMISDAIKAYAIPRKPAFALVGNLHARNTATSAAGLLRASGEQVVTYVFDARKASKAWIQTGAGGEGVHDISARFCSTNDELSMGGVIVKDTPGARWDRCVSLEQFSASFPIGRR